MYCSHRSPPRPSILLCPPYWKHGHATAFDADALLTVFQLIDENGDGDLTLEELSKCLSEYGERMSAEELKWMVDTFGKDNSINYNQLCEMIVSVSESCQASDLPSSFSSSHPSSSPAAAAAASPSPRKHQQQPPQQHHRSPSPDLLSMHSSSAPSPAMTPVAGASSIEPQNLDAWACDRLHGT